MIGWFLLWDYFDLAGNLDKFINQGHGFLDDIIHAMRCIRSFNIDYTGRCDF